MFICFFGLVAEAKDNTWQSLVPINWNPVLVFWCDHSLLRKEEFSCQWDQKDSERERINLERIIWEESE